MHARFLHFADCHLGYRQYNHTERANDFARAFFSVIEVAIREQVDFVILAGDLFQKRAIDALTLNQAVKGLERLRTAGIPCIAVEGNHELAYFGDQIGWVRFLALNDLLILLNPKIEEGEFQLKPYAQREGAYVEPLPGLRIYGLGYKGSSTAVAVEKYAEALARQPKDGIDYTIFIAHAGVEEALPEQGGGLSLRQWSVLRPHVDYLALGHVHKPFAYDDWIFNPGSTETCSIAETEWEDRGYYLVEIDTDHPQNENSETPIKHRSALHSNPRRRFHRVVVKTDLLTSPDHLLDHCRQLFQRKARDFGVNRLDERQRPVVELLLTGMLPFERSALNLNALETLIEEHFQPLLPLVKNLTHAPGVVVESSETLSRLELEKQVLTTIFNQDTRFREQSEAWTHATLAIKKLALINADPAAILEELDSLIASGAEG
ncbi:MAG: exonuclease SbcCD subunit D [Caldilineaceae bacterium]